MNSMISCDKLFHAVIFIKISDSILQIGVLVDIFKVWTVIEMFLYTHLQIVQMNVIDYINVIEYINVIDYINIIEYFKTSIINLV